jgi:hypothetical protein
MTQYVNQGVVVGQPMSPFFGLQQGVGPAPIIEQPTTAPTAGGMQATGVQMSMLEAASRGLIPRNAQLATIAGQSVSAGVGGMQATGVQMSLLEACSRGVIPRNAYIASVAGVAPSAGISNTNGDSMSVDEAMSDGNGAQACGGVAVNPNASTPVAVTTGGVNNQIFVEGIANANGALSTGPVPTNTESLTSAPTPASMTTASVALVANSFAG